MKLVDVSNAVQVLVLHNAKLIKPSDMVYANSR